MKQLNSNSFEFLEEELLNLTPEALPLERPPESLDIFLDPVPTAQEIFHDTTIPTFQEILDALNKALSDLENK